MAGAGSCNEDKVREKAMIVEKDKAVYFDYTLTDDEGTVLDTTEGQGEFAYIHGHGNLIAGMEKGLEGRREGEAFEITVEPEEGYGEYVEEAVVSMPRSTLEEAGVDVEPGVRVQAQGPEGPIDMTIVDFDDDTVTLDANHPLAGKRLHFAIRVAAIREAHPDEKKHGRLHPGGHHLMVEDSSFDGDLSVGDKQDG